MKLRKKTCDSGKSSKQNATIDVDDLEILLGKLEQLIAFSLVKKY